MKWVKKGIVQRLDQHKLWKLYNCFTMKWVKRYERSHISRKAKMSQQTACGTRSQKTNSNQNQHIQECSQQLFLQEGATTNI